MVIKLTAADWRTLFPRAPQVVIEAFASKQGVLDKAGITASQTRLAYFLANIEHECGGFSIRNLTENINYTVARMAQVWPNRFANAATIQAKYGTGKGWQLRAFDDIYGHRMGNRPGTSDGSTYIGRGGPQWTGRDGYAALERLTGLPVVSNPALACRLDLQPEICAAFWAWKRLNRFADAGDFVGCVRAWNGGANGLADRRAALARYRAALRALPVAIASPPLAPSEEPERRASPVAPAAPASRAARFIAAIVAALRRE